jgi:hypothetical protein
MFAGTEAAQEVLPDYFNEPGVELLLELLSPTIVFAPVEGTGVAPLGATRIGGAPDLPAGRAWPVRPAFPDADAIARRGGAAHAAHIAGHAARALPFQFAGIVDLAQAAALGAAASHLPGEGRLLIFYDGAVLPWHNGTETCKVIWDAAPADRLGRAETPQALLELDARFQAEMDAARRQRGWKTGNGAQPSPYWGPPRAMRLRTVLRPPDRRTIEAAAHEALAEALEDDDFEASYDALFDDQLLGDGGAPSRHQLLGSPLPVQDDPRCSAVVAADFGRQHLSPEAWRENRPRILQAAADWQLLLQLDLADCLQDRLAEGTVYFLIRRADLAARAFDNTLAVYQQT